MPGHGPKKMVSAWNYESQMHGNSEEQCFVYIVWSSRHNNRTESTYSQQMTANNATLHAYSASFRNRRNK